MHLIPKLSLAVALTAALSGLGSAQGPPPDPTHIPFTLPADIPWKGPHGGEYTATLFGDPSKPGPYGFLAKWMPGNFSHPHSTPRIAGSMSYPAPGG
jgi:hypothetical protein